MKRETYIQIITVILLALWLPVTMEQLFHFATFKAGILRQPFSDQLGYTIAYGLPVLEVITLVCLVFYRLVGFRLSSLLMAAFTSYIGLALLGVWGKLPCACGLVLSSMGWAQHLWFNLFFLAISVTGLKLQKTLFVTQSSIDCHPERSRRIDN